MPVYDFSGSLNTCTGPTPARLRLAALLSALLITAPGWAAPGTTTLIPATLHQPAQMAKWASRALIQSVARAGERLVAVGERGMILVSDDSGRSWKQVAAVPTSVTLTKVRFASPTQGWAIGHMGVVLRTVDGGATWTMLIDGLQSAKLALARAEQQAAVRPQSDTDGAATLRNAMQLVADGADKPLLALQSGSPTQMLALGAFGTGVRITSTAGGALEALPIPEEQANPDALHVYGLSERDGLLYAAGEQGLFLRSRRGGRFEALATPYKGSFFGVLALPDGAVLAYGLRGTVLRSANAGQDWDRINSGSLLSITSALTLADGKILLGSQSGQILASDDAGRSFTTFATTPQPVTDLAQAADGTVIAAGARGLARIQFTLPAQAQSK
jgi:photosystem II stability/assembly factor-like uncharacterized protein